MKTRCDKRFEPLLAGVFLLSLRLTACTGEGGSVPPGAGGISSDGELFNHVARTDPFASYVLFPRVDSVTSGTLNGSTAHQPLVRVSMNATAFEALRGDTLPSGSSFPKGSVIFKQIMNGDTTLLYAVIYKDQANSFSESGWLWAELRPDGTSFYSIANRGQSCTGCHALERGLVNDHVRTFERQGGD